MKLSDMVAQLEYGKDQLQKRVTALTIANTVLGERVDELERALKNPSRMPPLKLPPVMGRLLNMLIDHEFVSRDMAEIALTRGGTRKALDVHFSMLRRRLPCGVTIKNSRDQGWFIPANEKPVLEAALQ